MYAVHHTNKITPNSLLFKRLTNRVLVGLEGVSTRFGVSAHQITYFLPGTTCTFVNIMSCLLVKIEARSP